MLTLEGLKALGSVPASLKDVEFGSAVEFSEVASMDEATQATFDGTVVIDAAQWVATVSAIPSEEASIVFSSDGELVGRWDRRKGVFSTLKLTEDSRLATIKTLRLKKEDKQMAEIDLGNLNIEDAVKAATEAAGSGPNMDPVKSFETEPKAKSDKKSGGISDPEKEALMQRLQNAYQDNVLAPDSVVRTNRVNGRFIAFIVGSDSATKVSLKKVPVETNGQKELNAAGKADPEICKKYDEGKTVPARYYVSHATPTLTNAKPSPIKGCMIATPAGTDLPLTTIGTDVSKAYDISKLDKVLHIMSKETAMTYISYLYNGKITESSAVLGERATTLVVLATMKTTKTNPELTVSSRFVADGRKSLVIDGNYIPTKVYQTVPLSDSGTGRTQFDLNLESVYSRAVHANTVFDPKFTSQVRLVEGTTDQIKYSDVFKGELPKVKKYDGTGDLSAINIPVRKKVQKKNGDGSVYKFEFYELEDFDNGPLADSLYQDILKAANITADVFCKEVTQMLHSKAGRAKAKNKNAITHEQWLRGLIGKDKSISTKSIADLQEELDRLAV